MIRGLLLSLLLLAPAPARAAAKASYRHYLKALLLANQGSHAEALAEYEAALALDPQSVFIHEAAAELALEVGRTDRAQELAAKLVELAPGDASAHFLLGNVLWARGDWEAAKAAFEKTLELKPDFTEALFSLGNLLSSQSPEKAKSFLEQYLKENPDNASEAEYQIGLIEQRAGRLDAAVERLGAAVAADADNMQARYTLAQVHEVRRDTEAALGVYLEILERDPRNVALLNHVGEMFFVSGRLDRASEHFERAKGLMPTNSATCLWLALLAEQRGDFAGAAKSIAASAALETDASLNLRLSYYLTQDNRLKEAVATLEAAHKKWPQNDELAYFLGLGYDDFGRADKAAELLQTVVALRPEHRDARFQLGAMYEKTGDIKNAELQFREILARNPNDAASLNYLGYSLADRGLKLDEAETLINRAVELDGANGAYADSLGWVHFKQGRHAQAAGELERAVRMLPEDEAVWDHLGEAYRVLGDTVAAWDAWKSAQAFAQGKPPAKELERKLAGLESSLTPAELGGRYQAFLARRQGSLASYGGACLIEGKAGPESFRFSGILHFKSPEDLAVDVLGPMFVPVFRAALRGRDGFEMDPMELEGVSQELLREHLRGMLALVRDYLAGRYFHEGPAELKRRWRGSSIESPAGSLLLTRDGVQVSAVEPAGDGYRLELIEHRRVQGRTLPTSWALEGRGLRLQFTLSDPTAGFN